MAALVAVGVTLSLGSLVALVRRALRVRRAVRATGVVVHIETTYDVCVLGIYDRILVPREAPIIWFRTTDAEEVIARLRPARSGRYRRGQRVSCRYNSRNPQYIVWSPLEEWGDLIPFLVIGTFCLASVLWVQ